MRYTFHLKLSPDELARYYQGQAQQVSVRSEQNQVLRFAARHLRPYLTHDGISGRFELLTDEHNKLKSLRKI